MAIFVRQTNDNWEPAHYAASHRQPRGKGRATIVHMAGGIHDLLPGMETPFRNGNLPLHIAARFDNLPAFQSLASWAPPMLVFQVTGKEPGRVHYVTQSMNTTCYALALV